MRRLLILLLSTTLLAAACGGDDDDAEATAGGGETTANSDGESADSGGAVDEEATFRVVRHVGAVNFDPHRSPCSCDEATHTPVYEGLTRLSSEAEIEPSLAESWEYDESGTVLTLQLVEGATFHDGEAFDAEAAKANLDRALQLEDSTVKGALSRIESVEATGPSTLVINLSGPDAALLAQLAYFPGMMVSPAAFENPDLDVMPVGTGPYQVVEHRPSNLIVYERWDGYRDPDFVGSARLELQVIPDANARFNALRTGQAEAGALLSTALFQQAASADGLVAEPRTLLSFEALYMNRTRSELGNLKARQAIAHAIDKEALVAAVLGGLGEPQLQPFPPSYYAYNDELKEMYPYDPERARDLLAEAGLENGFSFKIVYPAYNEPAATAVQSMLAEVGIDVTIEAVEPAAIAEQFFVQQQGDAMLSSVSGTPDPQILFQYRYMPGGRGNPGGHTTPKMEQLFEEISTEVDREAREGLIHDAVKEIMGSVLEMPLYSVGAFLGPVVSDCVMNYGGLFGTRLQEATLKQGCA